MTQRPSRPSARWILAILLFGFGTGAASAQPLADAELVGPAGKCLDVLGGQVDDLTPVVLYTCHGGANQRWDFPARGTTGPVVGLGDKCLDVNRSSTTNRTPIQVFRCHGGENQQWTHTRDGRLVGLGGKCLDVLESSTADGAEIVLFDCHGGNNQLWRPRLTNAWVPIWPAGDVSDSPLLSVSVDPSDADTVYTHDLAAVLKTTDGGTEWQELASLPTGTELYTSAVAPDQRLYVGGSTAFGSAAVFAGRGASWNGGIVHIGGEAYAGRVGEIAVSPTDSDELVAVVDHWDGGIVRSDDGGITWRRTLHRGFLRTVARAKARPNRLYASGWDCVFRSDDGGETWREISTYAFPRLATDAGSDTAYGLSGTTLYRSRDGGRSWSPLTSPPGRRGSIASLTASPRIGGRVAVGTTSGQVFLSHDQGETWVELERGAESANVAALSFTNQSSARLWGSVAGRLQSADWTLQATAETELGLGASGRFKAALTWRDAAGHTGSGFPVALTSDTGYFWFFGSTNVEIVVKVLDARSINGHFWVFYGSLSDVDYTLTVTDTQTGDVKSYRNRLGNFGSAGDLEAF